MGLMSFRINQLTVDFIQVAREPSQTVSPESPEFSPWENLFLDKGGTAAERRLSLRTCHDIEGAVCQKPKTPIPKE